MVYYDLNNIFPTNISKDFKNKKIKSITNI